MIDSKKEWKIARLKIRVVGEKRRYTPLFAEQVNKAIQERIQEYRGGEQCQENQGY